MQDELSPAGRRALDKLTAELDAYRREWDALSPKPCWGDFLDSKGYDDDSLRISTRLNDTFRPELRETLDKFFVLYFEGRERRVFCGPRSDDRSESVFVSRYDDEDLERDGEEAVTVRVLEVARKFMLVRCIQDS